MTTWKSFTNVADNSEFNFEFDGITYNIVYPKGDGVSEILGTASLQSLIINGYDIDNGDSDVANNVRKFDLAGRVKQAVFESEFTVAKGPSVVSVDADGVTTLNAETSQDAGFGSNPPRFYLPSQSSPEESLAAFLYKPDIQFDGGPLGGGFNSPVEYGFPITFIVSEAGAGTTNTGIWKDDGFAGFVYDHTEATLQTEVSYALLVRQQTLYDPLGNEVCFLGTTCVDTDQGKIQFKNLTTKNTIDGDEIVGISRCYNLDDYMILMKKDSLGKNVPDCDTHISKGHRIRINDKMVLAGDLINGKDIVKDVLGEHIIYNVLFKTHRNMMVNNMEVESLTEEYEHLCKN
jgi:hypothetical protein